MDRFLRNITAPGAELRRARLASLLDEDVVPGSECSAERGAHVVAVPHRRKHPPLASRKGHGPWNQPGLFPSFKSSWGVEFWGPLQGEFLSILEADPRVRELRSKPRSFDVWDGERMMEHVPDFAVETAAGTVMADVIPHYRLEDEAVRRNFRPVRSACKRSGCHYRIYTDLRIRLQPRLDNAEMIRGNSGWSIPECDLELLRDVVRSDGLVRPADAMARGLSEGRAMAAALNLVWRTELVVDLGTRITLDSPFVRRAP